jgi:hypothetical protein
MEDKTMTIQKLAIVALSSLTILGAAAEGVAAASARSQGAPPSEAYFVVNLQYCTAATPRPDTRPRPAGEAAIVHEEVLIGIYGGDCQEFYMQEVRPRLHLDELGT